MKLDGKVALVTGGTAGIGRGIAEAFLNEGASVALAARNQGKAEKVLAELGVGDRAAFVQGDSTRREDCDRFVEETVARFGKIDILVNNAGGAARLVPAVDLYDEDWDLCMKWNLYSTFWTSRAALKHMIPQKWGRIINMSSVEGKVGKAVLSPYTAAKHGINGFTKAVAQEVAQDNITVNSLCPGIVITDIVRENGPATAAAMGISWEEMIALYTSESAIKRPIACEEIGEFAVVLASDAGAALTGGCFSIDGGTSAY
jgi:3-hydroxybutyrate dehydrogenase